MESGTPPPIDLVPLSPAEVAAGLESNSLFLIDVRSSGQYCTKHVKSSENLTFSNILLRRLLKGVVPLESLLPPQDALMERLCSGSGKPVVIYDSGSVAGNTRPDLAKYAEVICKAARCVHEDCRRTIRFIEGERPDHLVATSPI